jgi:hypothetical protein
VIWYKHDQEGVVDMTVENRIFEGATFFEVSTRETAVEFFVRDGHLHVNGDEDCAWDRQRTHFSLTPAEATALKNFLEKQGF